MPKISDEKRAAARLRLIDATIAVVERDGVDGLTTRAITAEAGVSAGMFYGHFDSKESLLSAVVDHKVDELTTLVEVEIEMGAPLLDVVRGMLRELVTVADLQALAVFRGASASDEARAAQRSINERIVEAFTPILDATIAAGVVRSDVDVPAVIEMIDLLIDGLNRRREANGFVSSDKRVTSVVISTIEAFLLTPQGEPS